MSSLQTAYDHPFHKYLIYYKILIVLLVYKTLLHSGVTAILTLDYFEKNGSRNFDQVYSGKTEHGGGADCILFTFDS